MQNRTEFERASSKSLNVCKKNIITIEQQITYISRFYPTPKFVEMTFDDTSASSNLSDDSYQSIAHQSSASASESTVKQSSPKGNHSIGSYGLSQIKAKYFKLDFNSKRPNENGQRSAFQTQFDYQQLIGELTFQQNLQQKAHFSAQKHVQRIHQFDLEERDKSFTSQKKSKKPNPQLNSHNQISNLNQPQNKTLIKSNIPKQLQSFKWDPPSEILFRKSNKLKWIIHIFNIHHTKNIQEAFEKMWFHGRTMTCKKCKRKIRRNDVLRLCSNCRLKNSSVFENDLITQSNI